jgi:hypothetical protein
METRHGYQHAATDIGERGTQGPAIEEFVRFCYHRRRVGWPELYDEMCAVAARGVFRGWGFAELADQGICFTLSDLPGLAAVAAEVSREERERARRLRATAKPANTNVAVDVGPAPRGDGLDAVTGPARLLSAAVGAD